MQEALWLKWSKLHTFHSINCQSFYLVAQLDSNHISSNKEIYHSIAFQLIQLFQVTRVSTQGSVTVTLNVITKDLARYLGGFSLRDSDWNYQQSLFRLGYETSNLRVSEKEVCIIFDVSSSMKLFYNWNTLWSINFHKEKSNWLFNTRARMEKKLRSQILELLPSRSLS